MSAHMDRQAVEPVQGAGERGFGRPSIEPVPGVAVFRQLRVLALLGTSSRGLLKLASCEHAISKMR